MEKPDGASPARGEKRKRRRLAVSCILCRRRKIGCDKKSPCSNCNQIGMTCEYSSDGGHYHKTPMELRQSVMDINGWSSQTRANATGLETPTSASNPVGRMQFPMTDDERSISPDPSQAHPGLKGRFVKSRLFGESHWMNNLIEFPNLVVWRNLFYDENGNMHPLLMECKQLARKLKSRTLAKTGSHADIRELIPRKEVCDGLVESYLNTFESVFRVFHVPTFRKVYANYWTEPQDASDIFLVKLLLVAAIGACCYNDEYKTEPPLHIQSSAWLYAVQAWLKVPLAKQCINIHGVQIHCLLVLALQTTAVGGDLSWIAAGSLVRIAMTIGLHRDPVHFPKMSVLQAEMRRRLWATTLELATQTSLDAGMPPMISWKDFDTDWPSNIDDETMDEGTTVAPAPNHIVVFTQTSIQCALTRSLHIRLKIVKLLNNLHSQLSHKDAVRIGTELTDICRANSKALNTLVRATSVRASRPTSFQIKMLDILTRRFLFSLHLPFAKKALTNVAYYYSRKVCVDSAILLLSYSPHSPGPIPQTAEEDHYTQLRIHGRGIFRSILIQASSLIGMELVTTLQEDSGAPTSSLGRNELFQVITETAEIARRRIEAGETNVRMYVCFWSVLGQIRALEDDAISPDQALDRTRSESLNWCLHVLKGWLARADLGGTVARTTEANSSTPLDDSANQRAKILLSDTALWDPNFATDDWTALLPPEWENEGWFFDDEL